MREKEIGKSVESDRGKSRTKDRENNAAEAKESEKDDKIQFDFELARLDAMKEEASRNGIDTHEMSRFKNQQNVSQQKFHQPQFLRRG